ncbi:conserved hypothetical protein, partial [Trichinella spiralis]|uniref:hypothetical protein n=1 Tax=Trichinella spiralis TaxID=6334 RepID=UPI0001EFE7D4
MHANKFVQEIKIKYIPEIVSPQEVEETTLVGVGIAESIRRDDGYDVDEHAVKADVGVDCSAVCKLPARKSVSFLIQLSNIAGERFKRETNGPVPEHSTTASSSSASFVVISVVAGAVVAVVQSVVAAEYSGKRLLGIRNIHIQPFRPPGRAKLTAH